MTVELLLIVLLLLCVGTLSFLLLKRIKYEKSQTAFIKNLSLHELTNFMSKNSLEGSIGDIARLFSGILKDRFNCEYMIFVRRKRDLLELNYYHGINAFNRADFKIAYSKQLMDVLKQDYFPKDIKNIEKFLSPKFLQKINTFQMDMYFPVYWRENLYGFYVIKSNDMINTDSYKPVLAQLAQSLSAAYHIKWHESKLENLLQNVQINNHVTEGDFQADRVLNLIKFKKTDAMIAQIVQTLQESTKVEKLMFMFDSKEKNTIQMLYAGKPIKELQNPKPDELHEIFELIKNNTIVSLDEIIKNSGNITLVQSLKQNKIQYLASFPLSHKRKGILAWQQNDEPKQIKERIDLFKKYLIDIFENVEELEELEELSYTDNLTSLSNRRYFYKRIDEELNRAERYDRKLALIIFDIDQLKIINDTYGHLAGDEVIRHVGILLKKYIRGIDVVARYGGDEFCIIMPEADLDTCLKFVNRLHAKIVNSTFVLEQTNTQMSCTISMGVAIYPDHAQESKNLIYSADMALLQAKEAGRNKILVASETTQLK